MRLERDKWKRRAEYERPALLSELEKQIDAKAALALALVRQRNELSAALTSVLAWVFNYLTHKER